MTIPKSPAVTKALKMVERGKTAYEAAKKAGCTPGALYKSAAYKAIIAARKAK